MNEKVIKRLPMASYIAGRKQNCPICGRKTEMYVDFDVELRPLTVVPMVSTCSLLYCVYCAIPFSNEEISEKIRKDNNGFCLMTFSENKEDVNETRFMIYNLDASETEKKNYIKNQIVKFKNLQRKMSNISSAIVSICADVSNESYEFIIVEDKNDENKNDNILLYTNDFAIELLSSSYIQDRHLCGLYNNQPVVIRQLIRNRKSAAGLPGNICPSIINICHGGGCYSSIVSKTRKLSNVLLYSSFYNRYELSKATVINSKDAYMDSRIFREFVHHYGNPLISLRFVNSVPSDDEDWNDVYGTLKKESIYKGYGYSASWLDGQDSLYRRMLLAEMIDLGIATVPEIKKYLTFLEKSHKSEKYTYAKNCWREDREFVTSYNPNPNRFLSLKED